MRFGRQFIGRGRRGLATLAMVTLVLCTLTATVHVPTTSAGFSATTDNSANFFSSDQLDPPTNVTGSSGGAVVLSWTPTVDTYATGYHVWRSTTPGGPYSKAADVTPISATGYTENPPVGTYYYVVRSYFGAIVSADSNEAVAMASAIGVASWWQTGVVHTGSPGDNRLLVFMASNEQQVSPSPTLSSVSYGGQPLTKTYSTQVTSGGKTAVVEMWILKEAQIQMAASNVLTPTWTSTPDTPLYSHVMLENVDQSAPSGVKAASTSTADTPNPLPIPALSTENLDMVLTIAMAGEVGAYSPDNGFVVGTNQDTTTGGTAAHGTAYKPAVGSPEQASMTFVPGTPPWINRQAQLAVVFKVAKG